MAAVVAASAMAVEVSGNVKWSGAVLEGDLDGATIIKANAPEASVTFAGENAGAEFKIELGKVNSAVGIDITDPAAPVVLVEEKNVAIASTAAIWFSPIDALKLTVGNGIGLNAYDYAKHESYDFLCDFTAMDGLTLSAALDGDFLTIAKGADAEWEGAIGLKAAYSADFGNIAAAAKIAKDDILIGLGYNGSTAGVSYEVAAQLAFAKEFDGVNAYAKVGYEAGNFSANAKATLGYKDEAALGVEAEAAYSFSPAKASVKISSDDLLAGDAMKITVEPKLSVSGTIGAVDCSTGIELNVGIPAKGDVTFGYKIPVEFSVSL